MELVQQLSLFLAAVDDMGTNQDMGGYSLAVDTNAETSYGVVFDRYTSDGTIVASVLLNDGNDFIILTIDDVVTKIPSVYDGTSSQWYADVQATIAANKILKIEIYSQAAARIDFGQFQMSNDVTVVANEMFDGGFDLTWYSDIGTDFTTNPGALSWSFVYNGGVPENRFLKYTFIAPVSIENLYIKHSAYESAVGPLLAFFTPSGETLWTDDNGTLEAVYPAVGHVTGGGGTGGVPAAIVSAVGYHWKLDPY